VIFVYKRSFFKDRVINKFTVFKATHILLRTGVPKIKANFLFWEA